MKRQLATILNVKPNEIMEYRQHGDIWNVIFSDGRKVQVSVTLPDVTQRPTTLVQPPLPTPQWTQAASNLSDVLGIGKTSLERLNNAGITTIQQLINADTKRLAKKLKIGSQTVKNWQENAVR